MFDAQQEQRQIEKYGFGRDMSPENKVIYVVRLFGVVNRFKPVEVEVEPNVNIESSTIMNNTPLALASNKPQELAQQIQIQTVNTPIEVTKGVPVSSQTIDQAETSTPVNGELDQTTTEPIRQEGVVPAAPEESQTKAMIPTSQIANTISRPQLTQYRLLARIINLKRRLNFLRKSLRYQHDIIDEDDFEEIDHKNMHGKKSEFRSRRKHLVRDTKF